MSGPFTASPTAYVIPDDAESLATLLQRARDEGTAVIPRGGGTGMPGGNLGPHLIVELGPGFRDLTWADEERTMVRAGAGVVAADAERLARSAGRTLPFLPSSLDRCRVGGMVANNAAGPRSFRHGSVAASVENVDGISSSGTPFRVGRGEAVPEAFADLRRSLVRDLGSDPPWPDVRKNSSGYALDRFLPTGDPAQLLVGSEGTLAFLTAAVLRTVPVPESVALVVAAPRSVSELTELAVTAPGLGVDTCEFLGNRLLALVRPGLEKAGIATFADGAYALVLLEVTGTRDAVASGVAEIEETLGRLGIPALLAREPDHVRALWTLREEASPTIAREAGRGKISTQFIEDSVVPPNAIGAYLRELDNMLRRAGMKAVVFGHAGDGNVHVNPLVDITTEGWLARVRGLLDDVVDLVSDLGGTLSGEHGDGRLRAPFIARIWPADLVGAFRRVKETLDPAGILNPGVILPLPGQDPLEGFHPRPTALPTGERVPDLSRP